MANFKYYRTISIFICICAKFHDSTPLLGKINNNIAYFRKVNYYTRDVIYYYDILCHVATECNEW